MGTRNWQRVMWAAALAFLYSAGIFAAAQEADYVSHKKCKMCHNKKTEGEQWTKWTQMKHAKALQSLSSDLAKEYATAAGVTTPPAETAACLRCHVTAYDPDKKTFHPAISKEDSIQCESCHGPGSLHLAYGKKMMMKKGDIDPSIPTQMTRPNETTCLKCHNSESPAWNPEKFRLKDGTTTGFDFDQAFAMIAHLNPLKKRE